MKEKLNTLAESIKRKWINPTYNYLEINGEYILIAGERRLRAHIIAGLGILKQTFITLMIINYKNFH